MSKQFTLIAAALSAAVSFNDRVVALRTEAQRTGALADAKTLREWLRPGVAKFYGHDVDAKFTREMAAERKALSRLAKAVMGEQLAQRVAKKVRVPRDVQATIAALVEQYGAAALREAIKRAS